jgi:PQQ-like domain
LPSGPVAKETGDVRVSALHRGWTLMVLLSVIAAPGVAFSRASWADGGGSELWRKMLPGFRSLEPFVATSPDGRRVFVGAVSPEQFDRYTAAAYDAGSGTLLWASTYLLHDNAFLAGVAVSPDGSKGFLTGGIGYGPTADIAVVAFDAATGAGLWRSIDDGPAHGEDVALALAASRDGSKQFVTGHTRQPGIFEDYDFVTIAYDASTGSRLWSAVYDGPAAKDDTALAVASTTDGSAVLVTGGSNTTATVSATVTIAYDAASGARRWISRFEPKDQDSEGRALAVAPDGIGAFVVGTGFVTIAYDVATGAQRWVTRDGSPGAGGGDRANSVAVGPDGSVVFVTGESLEADSQDYATVAYDTVTGNELWVSRYGGPTLKRDAAWHVLAAPDGSKVFVTGTSYGIHGYLRYATVAYDATTGFELWVARQDSPAGAPAPSEHVSLALSADGSAVYTSGTVWALTGAWFATIAYAT